MLALLTVFLVAAPAAWVAAAPASPGGGARSLAAPQGGAWFGAYAAAGSPQSPGTFLSLESAINRKLDIDRDYSIWDSVTPSLQVRWDVSRGVIPLLSIDPTTPAGRPIPWSSIASGEFDTRIAAQARALSSLGSPVLLSFDHEPEVGRGHQTPAQYVAAYRHYVTVFRHVGAQNVSFILILQAQDYRPSAIAQWYPGDSYVDWVGADGYNGFTCRGGRDPWRSFRTIFSSFNSFAVHHKKPAIVAEWASTEDPHTPGRKAAWIRAGAQTIQSWPQIKAALYFDGTGKYPSCQWPLTSSPSAMRAFRAIGTAMYFHARPTAKMTGAPTTGAAPLTLTFDPAASHGILRPIAAWTLFFGDGSAPATGRGSPPASVHHTYAPGSYFARLVVVDDTGQFDVQIVGVSADPKPTIRSEWPASVSPAAATLKGFVAPNGLQTSVRVEWGPTPALGSRTQPVHPGSGPKNIEVSVALSGLRPATRYYWRLAASSAAGSAVSPTKTFRTTAS